MNDKLSGLLNKELSKRGIPIPAKISSSEITLTRPRECISIHPTAGIPGFIGFEVFDSAIDAGFRVSLKEEIE